MSKTVKIISTAPHRANQLITLPEGLGTVQFDENCKAEIDEEIAEKITAMEIGIDYEDEETSNDDSFSKESLMKLTAKELKETCAGAGIPEEEYKKINNKTQLVDLILSKLEDPNNLPFEETEEEKIAKEQAEKEALELAEKEALELANKGTGTPQE